MDWFLYDNGLHHERVKCFGPSGAKLIFRFQTPRVKCFLKFDNFVRLIL